MTILIDDNPRRARHVSEQISVERKFVEECAVLFPLPNQTMTYLTNQTIKKFVFLTNAVFTELSPIFYLTYVVNVILYIL